MITARLDEPSPVGARDHTGHEAAQGFDTVRNVGTVFLAVPFFWSVLGGSRET
jgi:hypothetical protein